MKNAGLLDGDVVVVEAHTLPRLRDIVVAVVDHEVTVKRLRWMGSAHGRWSPPTAYDPIRPTGSLEVLGAVTGPFRRYRR